MNKHEEARKDIFTLLPKVIGSKLSLSKFKKYENIISYINEAEATEKELEELKKDVQRYLEIEYETFLSDSKGRELFPEYSILKTKLSKVSKEV